MNETNKTDIACSHGGERNTCELCNLRARLHQQEEARAQALKNQLASEQADTLGNPDAKKDRLIAGYTCLSARVNELQNRLDLQELAYRGLQESFQMVCEACDLFQANSEVISAAYNELVRHLGRTGSFRELFDELLLRSGKLQMVTERIKAVRKLNREECKDTEYHDALYDLLHFSG